MAWYPDAIRKEITRHRTPMTPKRFIFHTAVSSGSSLYTLFNQPGRATSHFYIRADGTTEQYVDTRYQAPAQIQGNHDCLSVETQDMGPAFPSWSGSDVPDWTPQQVDELVRLTRWVRDTHDIPAMLIRDSKNGREGLGYHRMGCDHSSSYTPKGWPYDQWRVPGGESWSKAIGKVCPGNRRIRQLVDVVIPRVNGDDEVTPQDIQAVAEAVWAYMIANPYDDDEPGPAKAHLRWGTKGDYAAVRTELDAIKAKLDTLGSGSGGALTKADLDAALAPFRSLLPGE